MKIYRKIKQKYALTRDYHLWCLLVVFCCFACSRSDLNVSDPVSEKTPVTFNLLLPSLNETKTHRNNPDIDKDLEIENLSVLVFEGNDDSTGRFLYRFSNLDVTAENQFTIDLKLSGSPIRVHVFANAPAGSLTDSYHGQIEKDALKNMEIKLDLNASSTYTIPMHGCIAFPTVVYGDISKDVNLLRSVARVDVKLAQNDLTSNFKLHGVAVYFTPKKGRLVSTSALTGSASNLSVSFPTMPITEYDILDKPGTVPRAVVANVGDQSISNNLFIYENQDYTNIAGSSKGNSRIVVSGYYNGATEVLSYYSVDFRETDSGGKKFIPILRNHQYLLNITAVTGSGYEEEEEAANNIPADIVASIIDWTPVNENIIFDGVNYFYVKEKSLSLYGDANVQSSLEVGSNIDPGEWGMRWGSADNYTKDGTLSGTNFTVEKPTKNEGSFLKFTTNKIFSSDVSEVLHIRVTDQLEFTITVNQRDGSILTVDDKIGTINVDISHTGGLYRVKVLTGSDLANWRSVPDNDLTNIIYDYRSTGIDGGYLTVDIEPNPYNVPRRGKMTVSRDGGGASDVILNFTQEAPTSLSDYVIVDVSATHSISIYDRNAGVNVSTTEQLPYAPNYTNNAPNVNPLFKGDYYTWDEVMLGQNSDGTSMCPVGWKLPTKVELSAIQAKIKRLNGGQNNLTSYIEDDITKIRCYFPMSGWGKEPLNIRGRYWSSIAHDGFNAYSLHLRIDSSNMTKNLNSHGLSVRCVKTAPMRTIKSN